MRRVCLRWTAYLEGQLPTSALTTGRLSTADLFCGSGGLALGIRQLSADIGLCLVNELIVDSDADATATLAANHDVRVRHTDSVTSLVDFRVRGWGERAAFTYEPELLDDQVADAARRADLLTAGPPCQGHSNLNNHSRRSDMRNHLMLTVPAFALAAGIDRDIIENVPAVVHGDASVIATMRALSERPECHKDGTSYTSVYGRMRPGEPAPTITTGFTTPGRGRFVHPAERRTLTPREAALIQGFPLDYRFITEAGPPPSRSQLAKWIGDAVPMPLGYAAALSALAATPI